MQYKIIIGQKDGKSYQKELSEEESKQLMGLKLKDTVKGDSLGFEGYEFQISGGSDNAGFPMRPDIPGSARKRILIVKGQGVKKGDKGIRRRRTVAGNTIGEQTAQINLKIAKAGKTELDKIFNPPEAPAEKPAE